MFYYISGTLAQLTDTFAVVDAGGVGYKLTISYTTYQAMPPHITVEAPPRVQLYTYMAVKEDGVELFGFASTQELSVFKMLLTVSGVGPKAAISVLSQLSPEKFALAVCSEDTKAISKANGVGAKTAARIVLELKDKLLKDSSVASTPTLQMSNSTSSDKGQKSKLSEAQDALMVLGYTKPETIAALQKIDIQNTELEEIIRLALKSLMKYGG